MPKPIKRSELIRRLRKLGWEGPCQKGKHPFMTRLGVRLTIPNPHKGDIDWSLSKRILEQGGISLEQWESL
ncbi:MAG TPA: type II toxin-antitoxin system HicA family toxin [Candidatus Binatia bacterium]|jgi:predicted RNA binding protein YcfA (HicA-like mRNA interferase family)|nr:type II toxin-antitoxin system HicA family toxin [Candidatus Binatia bacterium]